MKQNYTNFLFSGFLWNALLEITLYSYSWEAVNLVIRVKIKKSTLFFKISIALMALRIRKKIIPSHFLWLPCSTKNFILKFK